MTKIFYTTEITPETDLEEDVATMYDDETFELHPLIKALVAGEVITNVDVLEEFEDDHIPCYILKVSTDVRQDYLIALWWCGADGLLDWVRCEDNAKNSKKMGDDYAKEAEGEKLLSQQLGC